MNMNNSQPTRNKEQIKEKLECTYGWPLWELFDGIFPEEEYKTKIYLDVCYLMKPCGIKVMHIWVMKLLGEKGRCDW